jgi:hypothetical protein
MWQDTSPSQLRESPQLRFAKKGCFHFPATVAETVPWVFSKRPRPLRAHG